MSENQRQFQRKEVQIEVVLHFVDDAPRTVITKNVSQGGMFIRLSNAEHYTMGEMVNLSFKDPDNDFAAAEKDAIIVRHTDSGIAVAYIEMDGF